MSRLLAIVELQRVVSGVAVIGHVVGALNVRVGVKLDAPIQAIGLVKVRQLADLAGLDQVHNGGVRQQAAARYFGKYLQRLRSGSLVRWIELSVGGDRKQRVIVSPVEIGQKSVGLLRSRIL